MPETPPPITLDDLLAQARRDLRRVGPHEAHAAAEARQALVVDIRCDEQRARDGVVPGALVIQRNVLEWRCAPGSPWRDERLGADTAGRRLVLMCDEGYQSSLAAATLQRLGLRDATDLDGGFQAWRAAGLPVVR
jgi:rhodanese-related sulfurtransferase